MHQGEQIRLTFNGKTVPATVLICSDNRKSLIVEFDCAMWSPHGGMYAGRMPLQFVDEVDGYVDLITRCPAKIEWLAEER